eukprot:m.133239 g.133239  ORF g.133239 m.133239 type:complete len:994 (-) comp13942_c0_seq11:3156-6137(-)
MERLTQIQSALRREASLVEESISSIDATRGAIRDSTQELLAALSFLRHEQHVRQLAITSQLSRDVHKSEVQRIFMEEKWQPSSRLSSTSSHHVVLKDILKWCGEHPRTLADCIAQGCIKDRLSSRVVDELLSSVLFGLYGNTLDGNAFCQVLQFMERVLHNHLQNALQQMPKPKPTLLPISLLSRALMMHAQDPLSELGEFVQSLAQKICTLVLSHESSSANVELGLLITQGGDKVQAGMSVSDGAPFDARISAGSKAIPVSAPGGHRSLKHSMSQPLHLPESESTAFSLPLSSCVDESHSSSDTQEAETTRSTRSNSIHSCNAKAAAAAQGYEERVQDSDVSPTDSTLSKKPDTANMQFTKRIETLALRILAKVLAAMETAAEFSPPILQMLMHSIGDPGPSTRALLGDLLISRLLNPYLQNPELFGCTQNAPTPQRRRNLATIMFVLSCVFRRGTSFSKLNLSQQSQGFLHRAASYLEAQVSAVSKAFNVASLNYTDWVDFASASSHPSHSPGALMSVSSALSLTEVVSNHIESVELAEADKTVFTALINRLDELPDQSEVDSADSHTIWFQFEDKANQVLSVPQLLDRTKANGQQDGLASQVCFPTAVDENLQRELRSFCQQLETYLCEHPILHFSKQAATEAFLYQLIRKESAQTQPCLLTMTKLYEALGKYRHLKTALLHTPGVDAYIHALLEHNFQQRQIYISYITSVLQSTTLELKTIESQIVRVQAQCTNLAQGLAKQLLFQQLLTSKQAVLLNTIHKVRAEVALVDTSSQSAQEALAQSTATSISQYLRNVYQFMAEDTVWRCANEDMLNDLLQAAQCWAFALLPIEAISPGLYQLQTRLEQVRSYITVESDHIMIAPKFRAAAPFTAAHDILQQLSHYDAPTAKLDQVSQACKVLQHTLAAASNSAVGADDLLPALVFVISQAKDLHPWRTIDFVSQYAEGALDSGEDAYYWAVFSSAVDYLGQVVKTLSEAGLDQLKEPDSL